MVASLHEITIRKLLWGTGRPANQSNQEWLSELLTLQSGIPSHNTIPACAKIDSPVAYCAQIKYEMGFRKSTFLMKDPCNLDAFSLPQQPNISKNF